jgi:hypothetical protein
MPCHLHVPIVLKSGSLSLLESPGPVKACNGIALPFAFLLQTSIISYLPPQFFVSVRLSKSNFLAHSVCITSWFCHTDVLWIFFIGLLLFFCHNRWLSYGPQATVSPLFSFCFMGWAKNCSFSAVGNSQGSLFGFLCISQVKVKVMKYHYRPWQAHKVTGGW